MRLIYTLLIVLVFAACSKGDQMGSRSPSASSPSTQVVNAAIIGGAEYTLPVSAGNTKIYKQPSHFELSTINVDEKTGMTVYRYVSAKGFTGNDEVTLSESKTQVSTSGGGCQHGDGGSEMVTTTTFVKIKFTVSK